MKKNAPPETPDWENVSLRFLSTLDSLRLQEEDIEAEESEFPIYLPKISESIEASLRERAGEVVWEMIYSDRLWEAAEENHSTLDTLCGRATRDLKHIRKLAKGGHSLAIGTLAELAIRATAELNKLACESPQAFKYIAPLRFDWPLLWSPYVSFNQKPPDWVRRNLGKAFPLRFSSKSRFSLKTGATGLAWKLWHHVNRWRIYAIVPPPPGSDDLIEKRCFPGARAQLTALPQFRKDSTIVGQWFAVAKLFLIAACHKEQTPDELDENHPALKGLAKGYRVNEKKTAKDVRNKIFEEVENKFYYFAGLAGHTRAPRKPKKAAP